MTVLDGDKNCNEWFKSHYPGTKAVNSKTMNSDFLGVRVFILQGKLMLMSSV